MLRTEKTNDPSMIARQARMTSINAALQIDLYDQANASHVRGQIHSGFGGSTDFIVGALHFSALFCRDRTRHGSMLWTYSVRASSKPD